MKYFNTMLSSTRQDFRAVEKWRAVRLCGRRSALLTACLVLVLIAWSLLASNTSREVSVSDGDCAGHVNTETFNELR